MKLLVLTHVIHTKKNNQYFAYGPYTREMNIWFKYATEVTIMAALSNEEPDKIDLAYQHHNLKFSEVAEFNLVGIKNKINAIISIPSIFWSVIKEMKRTDHIHLRCPGNMGFLGLFAQVFFPSKIKTIKYAGNWDDYENEPMSYKIQKSLAKNTTWTKNAKVLIYGQWDNFTTNCVSFFTASYTEKDKLPLVERSMTDPVINLLFLGTLDERKRPEYSIETLKLLIDKGYKNVRLDILGKGPFEELCKEKIKEYHLEEHVVMHGNVSPIEVQNFVNKCHLLIFLSRMEGWPKVVAESMWWGCVPVTTAISCVPWMLDKGNRGMIIERNPQAALKAVEYLLENPSEYKRIQKNAVEFARGYTLDKFEESIKTFLVS